MPPRLTSVGRGPLILAMIAGVAALSLGGCGRRGQPEPPGQASGAPAAAPRRAASANAAAASPTTLATRPQALVENTPDDETGSEDQAASVSPQPTPGPATRRRRPYDVPKQPFILDPLL